MTSPAATPEAGQMAEIDYQAAPGLPVETCRAYWDGKGWSSIDQGVGFLMPSDALAVRPLRLVPQDAVVIEREALDRISVHDGADLRAMADQAVAERDQMTKFHVAVGLMRLVADAWEAAAQNPSDPTAGTTSPADPVSLPGERRGSRETAGQDEDSAAGDDTDLSEAELTARLEAAEPVELVGSKAEMGGSPFAGCKVVTPEPLEFKTADDLRAFILETVAAAARVPSVSVSDGTDEQRRLIEQYKDWHGRQAHRIGELRAERDALKRRLTIPQDIEPPPLPHPNWKRQFEAVREQRNAWQRECGERSFELETVCADRDRYKAAIGQAITEIYAGEPHGRITSGFAAELGRHLNAALSSSVTQEGEK